MKKTPLRKKRRKSSPLQLIKEKAWKVFSLFIRNRDKFVCFTCGVRGDRTTTNAGHFKHNVLDFDEVNIHCQCIQCNHYKSGNLDVYAEKLVKMYGAGGFGELLKRARLAQRGERMTIQDYQNIIDKYGEPK